MSKRSFYSGIGEFFDTFSSAVAVSNAVRNHRTPRASDLTQLGIDPTRFPKINR